MSNVPLALIRETVEGFDIHFYVLIEYGQYIGDDPDGEIQRKIDDGELEWFCAKVVAEKCGVELAWAYLGNCVYKTYHDFVDSGYYADMRDAVIEEAKEKIKELAETLQEDDGEARA